jgi:hypothetical protein
MMKETRDGGSDEYVAKARGFRSVDEWIEFRDGSPETRNAIIERREGIKKSRNRESRPPRITAQRQQAYDRYRNDDSELEEARNRVRNAR